MAKLKNTQINALVNQAYRQMTGAEAVANNMDLSAFCDGGTNAITEAQYESFFGKLLATTIENWYLDSSYRSQYVDPFLVNRAEFGGIMQMIAMKAPEVAENSAWKEIKTGDSVGTYKVSFPTAETKFYLKQESWALPYSKKTNQLQAAFKNAAELESFVTHQWMVVDNAILAHLEDLDSANRNGLIAHLIEADKNNEPGIHVIKPVAEFAKEKGLPSMTVEEFNNNADALRYAIERTNVLIDVMKKQTSIFTVGGRVAFVPDDRLVVQLLSPFVRRLENVALSNTKNPEFVPIPKHQTVPAWQSLAALTFDEMSSINVTIEGSDGQPVVVNKGGIVGLVADSWAAPHSIVNRRTPSKYFEIEDLYHFEPQFVDRYMVNTSVPAFVIVLEDYTATA